jgi:hypothetical protein
MEYEGTDFSVVVTPLHFDPGSISVEMGGLPDE